MNKFQLEEQEIFEFGRHQRLTVLIWGPGDPGESGTPEAKKAYEKRCLMRTALQDILPRSEVLFSEEIKKQYPEMSQLDQQTVDAKVADLVIILDVSRGAHLELDYFSKFSWFRTKVWLFVPQKYLDTPGLADEVYKTIPEGQRRGFTDEEYERCDVAKVMSVNIGKIVAGIKLISY